MADSAVVAAIAGLLGVGLSGGTQTALAVRSEHRNRRAAMRLLEDELMTCLTISSQASRRLQSNPEFDADFARTLESTAPSVFPRLEDTLARELRGRQWDAVTGAYNSHSLLMTLYQHANVDRSAAAVAAMAGMAEVHCAKALVALAPRRHRPHAQVLLDMAQERQAELNAIIEGEPPIRRTG